MLALRVGIRYAWSRRRELSRVTNWVSMLGLVFGVALLIVVLSVYNGLTDSGNDDFFHYVPHALITVADIDSYDTERILQLPGVTSVERFTVLKALVQAEYRRDTTPMMVYGLEREIMRDLPLARLPKRRDIKRVPAVAISAPGSKQSYTISMTVPVMNSQGISARSGAFEVLYTFEFPDYMFDNLLITTIDELISTGLVSQEQVQLRVTVEDPFVVDRILEGVPNVDTWTTQFGGIFQALAMEKTLLFVMLMFVVALAALNVVAGQAMLINRKSGDIAIFRTMGADLGWITKTFLLHGTTVVILGVVLGILVGLILSHFAADISAFVAEVFFAESLPMMQFLWNRSVVYVADILWTVAIAIVIGFLAILWPLSAVYKRDPIEALSRTI